MGRKKEAKEKKQRGSSWSASSSRLGLELTASKVDPPGSSVGGLDDDNASVLSLSSLGVRSATRKYPGFQSTVSRNTRS